MLTLPAPEKLKNAIFAMPIIPQPLNINTLRTISAKSINLATIRKLIEYSLKNVLLNAMFTPCLFLPFTRYWCWKVGRYYHLATGEQGEKGLKKISVKKQKNIQILFKLLKKWLEGFEWFFICFILFNLLLPKKLKNSIFGMSIIPQTSNIKNLRTTSAKSINLDTIRKLIGYYLRKVLVKAMFTITIFKILLFEGRSVLPSSQWGTGSEKVNILYWQCNMQFLPTEICD